MAYDVSAGGGGGVTLGSRPLTANSLAKKGYLYIPKQYL